MKTIVAICLCLYSLFATAQKRDYTWHAGYSSWGGYDSAYQHWFGITRFEFDNQSMHQSYDSFGISFGGGANYTMSDEDGNVQFYTNGITIKNAFDETIENGDSLHNGFF